MASNDVQVRTAKKLAAVIKQAKPNANVFHYWIIGQGPIGESFPDMVSNLETQWSLPTGGWPHGYVIGYDTYGREWNGTQKFKDTNGYLLWAFYGFMKGTPENNSSDVFSVHCKDVQNAISQATKFQSTDDPNGVPEVVKHYEWQITQAGVYWMGEHKVHIAQGELNVEARLHIAPTSIT